MKKISHAVGDGALVFAVTLVAFTIAAALWGWGYPSTKITITASLGADPTPGTEDAGFRAFAIFAAYSTGLGALLALWAYHTRIRSLSMLVWVTLCAAIGAVWSLIFGSIVVEHLHSFDATMVQPGQVAYVTQTVPFSVVLVCAPAAAAVVYWGQACWTQRF